VIPLFQLYLHIIFLSYQDSLAYNPKEFLGVIIVPNQTDNPTFNSGMYKVAIKGTPTFLKKGKAQESPCEGAPWLVSSGTLAMKILCTGSPLVGLFKSVKVSHTDSEEPVVSKQRQ
jgi:hypothetical protein